MYIKCKNLGLPLLAAACLGAASPLAQAPDSVRDAAPRAEARQPGSLRKTGVQHPALGGAGSTRQRARAPAGMPGESLHRVSALSDEQTNEAILLELIRTPNMAMGRELKLTTRDGHVTLAGQPRDEAQRRQILAAAERVVGAANVDDQMKTQSTPMARR